jgi:hypothetical protein
MGRARPEAEVIPTPRPPQDRDEPVVPIRIFLTTDSKQWSDARKALKAGDRVARRSGNYRGTGAKSPVTVAVPRTGEFRTGLDSNRT